MEVVAVTAVGGGGGGGSGNCCWWGEIIVDGRSSKHSLPLCLGCLKT